jgi:hypothetical protein
MEDVEVGGAADSELVLWAEDSPGVVEAVGAGSLGRERFGWRCCRSVDGNGGRRDDASGGGVDEDCAEGGDSRLARLGEDREDSRNIGAGEAGN